MIVPPSKGHWPDKNVCQLYITGGGMYLTETLRKKSTVNRVTCQQSVETVARVFSGRPHTITSWKREKKSGSEIRTLVFGETDYSKV